MTGDLILTAQFQDVPVRIIQREKDRVIPIGDIALATGYDRRKLFQLIDRNKSVFSGFEGVMIMGTPGGDQNVRYLTRDGVLGLLMKLSTGRIQDIERRERIITFQRWAIDTLGKVMDSVPTGSGPGVPIQNNPEASAMLEEHLRMARALTEYAGVKQGIAAAVAIAVVQEKTGIDLTWCKNLLPAASDPPGYLIPSEIGMQIGMSAQKVNEILYDLGYQGKAGTEWRLTGPGRAYGEEYPFSRNGHSGYQIRWKPEVIKRIGDRVRGLQQLAQQPAITGYLS